MHVKMLSTLLVCVTAVATVQEGRAEFSLNFMPQNTGVMSTAGGTQTPYLMSGGLELPEVVYDSTTGSNYYHLIVGSPADGFIQEVYIQVSCAQVFQGGCGSAVGGSLDFGADPLETVAPASAANGEGNPQRVLIRQIVSDGEVMMEFLKDKYDNKPKITQMLNTPDISALFDIDMRNSTYTDMNTPGVVTNTMSLTGPDAPGTGANFDLAQQGQFFNITGGRYTYTPGTGPAGSDGTYNYFGGTFDHRSQDWASFFDKNASNPWSNSTNKPK